MAICAPTSGSSVGNAFAFGCTLDAAGPYSRWTVNVTAVASNTMDINNEERVAAADPVDPDTANNFATASINVLPVADVVVFKQVAPTTVNAGEQLVYTLTVANFGPSIACERGGGGRAAAGSEHRCRRPAGGGRSAQLCDDAEQCRQPGGDL